MSAEGECPLKYWSNADSYCQVTTDLCVEDVGIDLYCPLKKQNQILKGKAHEKSNGASV